MVKSIYKTDIILMQLSVTCTINTLDLKIKQFNQSYLKISEININMSAIKEPIGE